MMPGQPEGQPASQVMISVVMPAYNSARTLKRAVDSVFSQGRFDLELIVVDDGSSDETPAILESYGPKVRALAQENQGVSAARNAAISAAQGEFVAFLDADDEWLPGKLERQLRAFEEHPQAGLVATGACIVDPAGNVLDAATLDARGRLLERMLFANLVVTSSVLVRRACLQGLPALFRVELTSFAEDWELWIRLAARHEFVILPERLVRYTKVLPCPHPLGYFPAVYNSLLADPLVAPLVLAQRRRLDANADYYDALDLLAEGRYLKAAQCVLSSVRKSSGVIRWRSLLAALLPYRLKSILKRRGEGRVAQ